MDGGTAVRLCETREPDLILVAENMPGLRAADFLDAGLSGLLNRRVMMIPRRTAAQPRWLPTLSLPADVERLKHQLGNFLKIRTRS